MALSEQEVVVSPKARRQVRGGASGRAANWKEWGRCISWPENLYRRAGQRMLIYFRRVLASVPRVDCQVMTAELTISPMNIACAHPILLFCGLTASISFGQGSLDPPPGPPAPTMKSLDQIEPRTIINSTNTPGDATNTFVIRVPGSYYLTGNVTGGAGQHGISIQADDVTLDLGGFALVGGGGAAVRGVDAPAPRKNLAVRNGTVRGWSGGGIRAESVVGALVEMVRVCENAGAVGLWVGNGGLVKDCVATANGIGFQANDRAQIVGCVSTINTGNGIELTNFGAVSDCTSSRNGGHGIRFIGTALISRCQVTRNNEDGISQSLAQNGGTIVDCSAFSNVGHGIAVFEATVAKCSSCLNTKMGIFAETSKVSDCLANRNGWTGIFATAGSVTNCVTRLNGHHGIAAESGVVAFCKSVQNNQANDGRVDIFGGSARTGNSPAP